MNNMKTCILLLFGACAVTAQDAQVLAVVDLENRGGVAAEDIVVVSDAIAEQAQKDRRYFLFDRALVEPVLAEQGFPQTRGCSHEQCLTALGNLLAAHKIIGGGIRREQDSIELELLLVDVQSGAAESRIAISERASRTAFLQAHVPRAVKKLLSARPTDRTRREHTSSAAKTPRKRRPWWLPVTGVLAAGAAGAGALWYYIRDGGDGGAGESGPVSLDDAPVRER